MSLFTEALTVTLASQELRYDVVVLDLGLPKMDGVTVLERWRHGHGCRRWFNIARDTATDAIFASYPANAPPPDLPARAGAPPPGPLPPAPLPPSASPPAPPLGHEAAADTTDSRREEP